MFKIFIPTRGRTNRQITRKSFCLDQLTQWPVTYVVPECEFKFWRAEGVDYLIVPDSYKFSDIRQTILLQKEPYHLVLDDDLRPAIKDVSNLSKLLDISEQFQSVRGLFSCIEQCLELGWIHGGISVRQGNNRVMELYKMVGREMRTHFYNADVVKSLNYDFCRTITKQDLDFTLWMLKLGIPNLIIYKYCQEQAGNNVQGGCSRYRTSEVLRQGAERLAELHPEFVKVITKKPKVAWKGEERVDVNIQWKKAYQAGQKYLESLQIKPRLTVLDKIVLELQPQPPAELPAELPAP